MSDVDVSTFEAAIHVILKHASCDEQTQRGAKLVERVDSGVDQTAARAVCEARQDLRDMP